MFGPTLRRATQAYWWKCVSDITGYSEPESFKTAYNYPRLVFVGNTSGSGDAWAEWEWGNNQTTTQGAACDIYGQTPLRGPRHARRGGAQAGGRRGGSTAAPKPSLPAGTDSLLRLGSQKPR
jgi:hypothetical protein